MSLREWAKKHIHKGESKEDAPLQNPPGPTFKVYRTDSMGITPLRIPDNGSSQGNDGLNTPSPVPSPLPSRSPSPKSPKGRRLSKLGVHRHSPSQVSLPDWVPPNESDPNAERDWEARATKLARVRPTSMSASYEDLADLARLSVKEETPIRPSTSPDGYLLPKNEGYEWGSTGTLDGMTSDEALQEAIRLHETGGIDDFVRFLIFRAGKSNGALQKDCGATL
jgi:hypothetical protein